MLSDYRRAEIRQAAARVIAARGFDAATVAQIAAGAGISVGTIYLYYCSKEEVLADIFAEEERERLLDLEYLARGRGHSLSKLAELVNLHIEWVTGAPLIARVIEEEAARLNRLDPSRLRLGYDRRCLEIVQRIVADGMTGGELAVGDPRAVAIMVLGAARVAASLRLATGPAAAAIPVDAVRHSLPHFLQLPDQVAGELSALFWAGAGSRGRSLQTSHESDAEAPGPEPGAASAPRTGTVSAPRTGTVSAPEPRRLRAKWRTPRSRQLASWLAAYEAEKEAAVDRAATTARSALDPSPRPGYGQRAQEQQPGVADGWE